MNTEKVFFGRLYRQTKINKIGYTSYIDMSYVKDVLVVSRRNIFGIKYMKDLNSGERYNINIPLKQGVLHVSRNSLRKFNMVTANKEKNMPKSKVKTLGNIYLLKGKEK